MSVEKVENSNKNMRALDLFSGVGGLSKGVEDSGYFNIVAGVDKDENIVKSYSENTGNKGIVQDLTKISPIDFEIEYNIENIDVVTGGPPCQGFSNANVTRNIENKYNNLIFIFLEYVNHYNPRYFLMENVKGIQQGKMEEKFQTLLQKFRESGYNVEWRILNSANYGVPQKRKRVFVQGMKNDCVKWPVKTHDEEEYTTTREAIADLPHLSSGERSGILHHNATNHGDDTVKSLDLLSTGESLYDSWSDSWKRLPWDEPAWTVTSRNKAVFVHPEQPRLITERECARLQDLPDSWQFYGNKDLRFTQIANAVPPTVVEKIAKSNFERDV